MKISAKMYASTTVCKADGVRATHGSVQTSKTFDKSGSLAYDESSSYIRFGDDYAREAPPMPRVFTLLRGIAQMVRQVYNKRP